MSYKAFVFDAYGTLFDVHSAVSRHAELVGANSARLSEIWRNKQLEYTWTRSGMGNYKDFWTLTTEALDFALEFVPDVNQDARDQLLEAYRTLDCYSEVPAVLKALKERGYLTAILSNGSPDMLNSAIESAGLSNVLDDAFSVHDVGVFKTNFATYSMVTKAYDIDPSQVSFQSSNRWDAAAASNFGFDVCWINRTNQPDEYRDMPPKRVISDLNGLLD
ncbi:MAG: haloacid dehalogenase type II [Rhizobiaceae bacterium]|nr:haloacid dehalogenase type II [Rhizobiaceae bacterium]